MFQDRRQVGAPCVGSLADDDVTSSSDDGPLDSLRTGMRNCAWSCRWVIFILVSGALRVAFAFSLEPYPFSWPFFTLPGQTRHVRVLFVLHDAGETYALRTAIRQLEADGVDVLVLPVGQPATDEVLCHIPKRRCRQPPAITLPELGIHTRIVDGTAGRAQLLPSEDVQRLVDALQPEVVITGMNYAMQLQTGQAFKQGSSAAFIAYYDGLRVLGSDSDISASLQQHFAQNSSSLWVPSSVLWPDAAGWGANYEVVGQPTLQEWQAQRAEVDELRSIRATLFGVDAFAKGHPAAIWFGGYGPGYEEALRAWCQVVRQLSPSNPGMFFAHAVHPGSDYRAFDIQVLQDEGVEHLIVVVPDTITGSEAALACNLTVSQGSTGGVQSVFAGKPALFLDPTRAFNNSENLGVRIGLIQNSHTQTEAIQAIQEIAAGGWSVDSSKLALARVPADATDQVVRRVKGLLGV